MLRHLVIAVAAFGALLLTGCASVVNGHTQSLSVVTKSKGSDVQGAKCSLSNDKGVWYVTSPGSVNVHRSYGELTVSCTLNGLPDGTTAAKSSTTGAVFGNILLGGAIGAGVDIATGAAYDYPNVIPVTMGASTRLDNAPSTKPGAATSTAAAPVTPSAPPPPLDPAMVAAQVPYLNDAQQRQYQAFLTRPLPRAFAISASGHYAYTYTNLPFDKSLPSDPSARALLICARLAGTGCELYAVDNRIVFQALPPQPMAAEMHTRAGKFPADPALAAAKVPFLNEGQLAEYQIFLTQPVPRAFAISDNGHYMTAWGSTPLDKTQPADPTERALAGCQRMAGQACRLYLVDNRIVYPAGGSQ